MPSSENKSTELPYRLEVKLDERMANQLLWQAYHALYRLDPPPRPGSDLRRIMDEIEAAAGSNWWRP